MPLWLARVILWTPVPLIFLWAAWRATENDPDRIVSWLKLSAVVLGGLAVAAGISTAFVVAVVTVRSAP